MAEPPDGEEGAQKGDASRRIAALRDRLLIAPRDVDSMLALADLISSLKRKRTLDR